MNEYKRVLEIISDWKAGLITTVECNLQLEMLRRGIQLNARQKIAELRGDILPYRSRSG